MRTSTRHFQHSRVSVVSCLLAGIFTVARPSAAQTAAEAAKDGAALPRETVDGASATGDGATASPQAPAEGAATPAVTEAAGAEPAAEPEPGPPAESEPSTATAAAVEPPAEVEPSEDVAFDSGTPMVTPVPTATKSFRWEVGGRGGYALAYGNLVPSEAMSDYFSGAIPLVFDGWLRFKGFKVGLYAGFAVGLEGQALEDCDDCSLSNFRIGAQVAHHFDDGGTIDPWVGAGLGYEASSITERITYYGVDYDVDYSYGAFPEAIAMAGLDFGGGPFVIGPFASISYAAYSSASATVRCADVACSADAVGAEEEIEDSSGHTWIMFGLRASYFQ